MISPAEAPLIDAHTHTHPTPAASQEFLSGLGLVPAAPGSPEHLIPSMDRAGIEWTMIVAFRPAQLMVEQSVAGGSDREQAVRDTLAEWHELNSWAAAAARAQPDRLKSVVGLDPVLMTPEQVRAEATTQLAAGASGLKIAPMFLGVPADHEAVEIVWQLAVEFDVPVLSESGAHGWGDQDAWGHPRHFLEVVRSYPTLRLQLAHLGQGAEDVMARVVRASPTVITDTALRFGGMAGQPVEVGDTVEKIRSIGAEYVAFGTNYPIVDQEAYAAVLREAGLTGPELRQVGHDNAARLWG